MVIILKLTYLLRLDHSFKMSDLVPDNDEQDRVHARMKIKAYLIQFHENETKDAMVKGDKMILKKKKPGMISRVKPYMDPKVKGVCGCEQYTKDDGSKDWKVTFEMWDKTVPAIELDLEDAKVYGTHVLAYYSNMHRLPLKYPEWEWTADEKVWPVHDL